MRQLVIPQVRKDCESSPGLSAPEVIVAVATAAFELAAQVPEADGPASAR